MTDHSTLDKPTVQAFAALFRGRTNAWGTGKGGVMRGGELGLRHYAEHLAGHYSGLGIFPLLDDGRCFFAAIDFDFEDPMLPKEAQHLLPTPTWLERTRSNHWHLWAFFREGIEAWMPRGIMREVVGALGLPRTEVFPKQNRLAPGMVGNYINLPYFGATRPIIHAGHELSLVEFLEEAGGSQPTNADRWTRTAARLGFTPPQQSAAREQGTRSMLHICATHIIRNRHINPVLPGARNVVMFNLAKQLLDYREFSDEEVVQYLREVNDAGVTPLSAMELSRIFHSAKRGRFTSTGCDDPLMAPYVSPECSIAKR